MTPFMSKTVVRTPARNIQVYNPTTNTLNVRWEPASGDVLQYRLTYAPLSGARPSESVSSGRVRGCRAICPFVFQWRVDSFSSINDFIAVAWMTAAVGNFELKPVLCQTPDNKVCTKWCCLIQIDFAPYLWPQRFYFFVEYWLGRRAFSNTAASFPYHLRYTEKISSGIVCAFI